jgi:hypothetical protein
MFFRSGTNDIRAVCFFFFVFFKISVGFVKMSMMSAWGDVSDVFVPGTGIASTLISLNSNAFVATLQQARPQR